MGIYAREGVGHLWFVNPSTQMLEVFRRASDGWMLTGTHGDDAIVRAEPFEAIAIELAPLWRR